MPSPRRSSRTRKQSKQGEQFRQEQTQAKRRQSDKKARDAMFRAFDSAHMGTAPSTRGVDDLSNLFGKTMVSKPKRKPKRTGPKKRKGKTQKRVQKRSRKGTRRRQSPKRGTKHGAHRRMLQLRKEKKDRKISLKRARLSLPPATFQFP